MAVYWLGLHESPTNSVRICYRAEANVDCYATVGTRRSSTVTANTSVKNGIVRLDVTGLRPGQTYDYAIYAGGALIATGQCDTLPESGEFGVAFLSCMRHDWDWSLWCYEAVRDHSPGVKVVIFQGDTPYMDVPQVQNKRIGGEVVEWGLQRFLDQRINAVAGGVAADYDYTDPTERALIVERYHTLMRLYRQIPGVRDIIRRYATVWQADDHERPGDNANREDIATLNDGLTVVGNTTQADQIFAICRECFQAWFQGNPANADADNDSNYDDDDQTYFRCRINEDIELFAIDTTEYKTSESDAAADRKIVGDTQLDWLLARVAASPSTFKLISSPASIHGIWLTASQNISVHPNTADGTDNGERDTMFKALDDETGVLFVCGDLHHTAISIHNGIAAFTSSPTASTRSASNSYADGRIWLRGGPGNPGQYMGQMGFIDVSAERLALVNFDLYGGGERPMGYIEAGSNELQFERTGVA